MKIRKIGKPQRRDFIDLLLLGDEQIEMVERYLDDGEMFVLYEGNIPVSASIVIEIGTRTFEIKNIATWPQYQGKGYGTALLSYITEYYNPHADVLYVGTGNNQRTLNFYKHAGFSFSHIVKDFFLENYDHPIFEDGNQLIDMIYLKKVLTSSSE